MCEAQQRVTMKEFKQWQAYAQIEPFGQKRSDLRMGILACAVLAPHSGRRKLAPADFMPDFTKHLRPVKAQSSAEIMATMNLYMTAQNKSNAKQKGSAKSPQPLED